MLCSCIYETTLDNLLFSAFLPRRRCVVLWSPVLAVCFPSEVVPSVDHVSRLVPLPVLQDATLLTMPFDLDKIKHPKIPVSAAARKTWTDAQRKAIKSSKPYTVRREAEFNKQVSDFFFHVVLVVSEFLFFKMKLVFADDDGSSLNKRFFVRMSRPFTERLFTLLYIYIICV